MIVWKNNTEALSPDASLLVQQNLCSEDVVDRFVRHVVRITLLRETSKGQKQKPRT